ncbi:hypothetical protein, partial [Psychrobacter sp.]|uniref:hypothetical protein n=1 Tax=Psychrobacter sp. TaxID=56811 RepID=UPI003F9C44F7
MSSFDEVEVLLSKQDYPVIEKKTERIQETEAILTELGVQKHSSFFKLYTKYFLRFLNSRSGADEIVDPLPP